MASPRVHGPINVTFEAQDTTAYGENGGLNLAFTEVSYTIPPGLLSRKRKGKVILDSIRY